MPEQRNNHKTMRISDEALAYIETFHGNTFNDKVNNMIDYFINAQKKYERDLRFYDDKIKSKKELLDNFNKRALKMKDFVHDFYLAYNELLK